jgi:hypothetical protein
MYSGPASIRMLRDTVTFENGSRYYFTAAAPSGWTAGPCTDGEPVIVPPRKRVASTGFWPAGAQLGHRTRLLR